MTESDNDSNGTFRVVDRRRFDAEGKAREGAPERTEPVRVAPLPAPAPASAREPVAAPASPRPPSPAPPRQPEPPPSAMPMPDPHADPGAMDFISFCASLGTNALAAMGAIPEAAARGMPVDLELAREYIDILGMLQTKTRGNLTRDEDAMLQRLLADLRLNFVELSKRRPGRS